MLRVILSRLVHFIEGTVCVGVSLAAYSLCSQAQATFVFPPPYDNTANTVIAGPTPDNNQTTGNYRDVYWWSINNGAPRVGSPDFINYGKNLVLVGNSAVDNGTGAYDALNFTGPSVSGGQSYLTVYDTDPDDGLATNKFGLGTVQSPLSLVTDLMFVKHNVAAGIMAIFNDSGGNDGLALLAHDRDGNNPDSSHVTLTFQNGGTGTDLATVPLGSGAFVSGEWYRVTMNLWQAGAGTWNVSGQFQHHTDDNPGSNVLGAPFGQISANGTLLGSMLSNPGEIGLIVQGREPISLPDNVGVSFYLSVIPEPSAFLFGGLVCGVIGLSYGLQQIRRRRECGDPSPTHGQ